MSFYSAVRELDGNTLRLAAEELLRLLDGVAAVPSLSMANREPAIFSSRRTGESMGAAETAAVEWSEAAESLAFERSRAAETAAVRQYETAADGLAERLTEMREATAERRRLAETLETLSGENLRAAAPEETFGTARGAAAGSLFRAARSGGDGDIFYSLPGASSVWEDGYAAPPGSDMDAISEFFRRDGRRYDAGFGG